MKLSYEDLLKQLKSARSAVRVWETTMMQACGKDDPASVAAKFAVPATKNLLPKSGLRFFSYDADSGLDDHATADEAIEAANASIAYYRGKSCDEGVDIVGSVCWGVIMQESAMTNLRTETDDSGRSREICDYVLLPSVETPITDSFLAPDYAELQRKYEELVLASATVISELQGKVEALAAENSRPQNSEATETLQKICNIFRIGIQAQTQSTILANVENAVRFADQLHAIEREFFMVPGEPDEDYPDDEPADVCLVNCWGSSSTEQYVEQFRKALADIEARGVDKAIERLIKKFEGTAPIGVPVMALEHLASELRKESGQ